MGERIVIHGRKVVGGKAAGEALVSHEAIGGFSSIDFTKGIYTERTHEICNQSFDGKILVFPNAKGSSGWSANWKSTRVFGHAPAALLITWLGTRSALGAVGIGNPAMTDFDTDPVSVIDTGDYVEVDADNGIVTVTKKS